LQQWQLLLILEGSKEKKSLSGTFEAASYTETLQKMKVGTY